MSTSPTMTSSGARRIPPIQCLLTFEALARLRSVTLTADELCVTPSAVSHRAPSRWVAAALQFNKN